MRLSLTPKLSFVVASALFLFASPNLSAAESCPGFVAKIKSSLSSIVGSSSESIQVRLDRVNEELTQVDHDYSALNNEYKRLGRVDPTDKAALDARKALTQKLKELHHLQSKRYKLEKKYFTIPMRKEYVGEVAGVESTDKLRSLNVGVHYIDPSKRDAYRVDYTRGGRLVDADGKFLQGRLLFVMDQDGNVYVSRDGVQFSDGKYLRHSSFLGGQPVAAAGEIVLKNGEVKYVNRRSGHYTPTQKANDQFLSHLREKGANTTGIEIGAGF